MSEHFHEPLVSAVGRQRNTRHTFVGQLPGDAQPGDEIFVEEFIRDDGCRTLTFAIREKQWHSWGPPVDLTQTS